MLIWYIKVTVQSIIFWAGKPCSSYEENNPDWVPSINMGYNTDHHRGSGERSNRYNRYLRLRSRRQHSTDLHNDTTTSANCSEDGTLNNHMSSDENEMSTSENEMSTRMPVSIGCQSTMSLADVNVLEQESLIVQGLKTEVEDLKRQVKDLKAELSDAKIQLKKSEDRARLADHEVLQHSPNILKLYTGIIISNMKNFIMICPNIGICDWAVLISLFQLVESFLPHGPKLSKFNTFMIFLMKVRLNLNFEDIAYRFDVNTSTVSRHFHTVLDIMFVRTKPLVQWPDRDVLRLTMPFSFRKFFKKCAIIIDCTEIFVERPSDLLARAQLWSNYKHHSTVKFLIGITPQGTISYLSKCAGGRISDKEIVETSSLVNHLLPGKHALYSTCAKLNYYIHVQVHLYICLYIGDMILADRGFTCQDHIGVYMAEIKIPPFTKGKKQLDKVEVDWSRELSMVRIHVERVIGLLKQKYTILQGTLPFNFCTTEGDDLSVIDKIVHVCSSLTNLSPSVIPQD